MKNSTLELKLPINYTNNDILTALKIKGINNIKNVEIVRKSLDARKKSNLFWNIKVEINGINISFQNRAKQVLNITKRNSEKKIIIVGSGPSGIFSGLVLLEAGFKVLLLEQGFQVESRDLDIKELMDNGVFKSNSNFAFGEGGAGTYSDGKLTSRNKHISKEKDYILSTFINNGAPDEIYSMVHPHIGSDNLKVITKNMRNQFFELGGEIKFNTTFTTFIKNGEKVSKIITNKGEFNCDYLLLATGHSSFNTYKELMRKGVSFKTKNFAIGFRAEHPQELINNSQWGKQRIEGLKAAEYRLTSKAGSESVFSFCMCPGGTIVPAAATQNTSVVNGMSNYARNGEFANAAVVSSFNFSKQYKREVSPMESLELLQSLEESYFKATGGYSVPGMKISDFINGMETSTIGNSSYPLGITPYNLNEILPSLVIEPLKQGLLDFSNKLKGYELGNIMGLESKTSSPIQVERDNNGLCHGFENLYFVGEGSGWAGGIISSAADGIKGALNIISKN